MSLSAFLQAYIKPTRWWRRHKTVQITVWPRWLAQALCPHIKKQTIGWDVEQKTKMSLCLDCHKHLLEVNDCAHGEVSVFVVETVENQLVVRSYRCEHCNVELQPKDLPHGTRIIHLNALGDH